MGICGGDCLSIVSKHFEDGSPTSCGQGEDAACVVCRQKAEEKHVTA